MSTLTNAQIAAKINLHITTNGANDITGAELNQILIDINDSKSNVTPIITSSTGSGILNFDLNTFNHHNLTINGNIIGLELNNGAVYQERVINISKDANGYLFKIANDHSDSQAYNQGDIVGVPSNGSIYGRIYYKAKAAISAGPFVLSEWDLYIKLQDDVLISLSYSSQEIDQLIITPKMSGSVMYYSITPIYNV